MSTPSKPKRADALRLDFTTARSPDACRAHLKRELERPDPAWHRLDLDANGAFTVGRRAAVVAILRAARRQPVELRGRLVAAGAGTRVTGRLARETRLRLALEFWRFPAVMIAVIALAPYHAFGTVIAALIVAIMPLVAVSWWRWWRLRRAALRLVIAVRARLEGRP